MAGAGASRGLKPMSWSRIISPPRDARSRERALATSKFLDDLSLESFDSTYPDRSFQPIVALVAAYLEEEAIGSVLAAIPSEIAGLPVTTLVIVDGPGDATAKIAASHGAFVCEFPVNRGHGVALRIGYQIACARGARYIVTIDADGQNDPGEMPQLLEPVLNGSADLVIASRRLGVDRTTNRLRKVGVRFFAGALNALTGQHLTDTSNGFRAMRSDVVRGMLLEQEQYQTAELLIEAARKGFRITERPTVWHPRAAGRSKKGNDVLFGLRYARVIARTWLREP